MSAKLMTWILPQCPTSIIAICVGQRTSITLNSIDILLLSYGRRTGPLPFYQFLSLLFVEAETIPMDIILMCEGKLKNMDLFKKQETNNNMLIIWDEYESQAI